MMPFPSQAYGLGNGAPKNKQARVTKSLKWAFHIKLRHSQGVKAGDISPLSSLTLTSRARPKLTLINIHSAVGPSGAWEIGLSPCLRVALDERSGCARRPQDVKRLLVCEPTPQSAGEDGCWEALRLIKKKFFFGKGAKKESDTHGTFLFDA